LDIARKATTSTSEDPHQGQIVASSIGNRDMTRPVGGRAAGRSGARALGMKSSGVLGKQIEEGFDHRERPDQGSLLKESSPEVPNASTMLAGVRACEGS